MSPPRSEPELAAKLRRALTGEGLDGSDLLSGLFVAPNSDPDEPPASNHPKR